jgi:hypothetical protein
VKHPRLGGALYGALLGSIPGFLGTALASQLPKLDADKYGVLPLLPLAAGVGLGGLAGFGLGGLGERWLQEDDKRLARQLRNPRTREVVQRVLDAYPVKAGEASPERKMEMTHIELAYVQGFVQKCGEAGINPDALAKFAVQVGPAGGQLMAAAPTQPQLAAFKGKARPQAPGAQPMPQPNPIAANLAAKKDLLQ